MCAGTGKVQIKAEEKKFTTETQRTQSREKTEEFRQDEQDQT
jgi:hypothetical protein